MERISRGRPQSRSSDTGQLNRFGCKKEVEVLVGGRGFFWTRKRFRRSYKLIRKKEKLRLVIVKVVPSGSIGDALISRRM